MGHNSKKDHSPIKDHDPKMDYTPKKEYNPIKIQKSTIIQIWIKIKKWIKIQKSPPSNSTPHPAQNHTRPKNLHAPKPFTPLPRSDKKKSNDSFHSTLEKLDFCLLYILVSSIFATTAYF